MKNNKLLNYGAEFELHITKHLHIKRFRFYRNDDDLHKYVPLNIRDTFSKGRFVVLQFVSNY